MWRTLQGTLLTIDRLRSRMVPVLSLCPVCVADRESSLHLIFECPLAMSCWILTPIPVHGRYESFIAWFSRVMSFCSPSNILIVVMVCWTLWTNRNNVVWRNCRWLLSQILNIVGRTLKQWQDVQQFSIIPAFGCHLVKQPIRWEKPKEGWRKVNVDVAIFSASSTTRLG